ncbi:MAG: AtpZ/AtpI family protein [Gemmataceae bacterium]|nr:AtpZ/AtpI family protein [Gemmataceae bacterium]
MAPRPENPKLLARLLMLSQAGTVMVAPIILGFLIDGWLGISPWGVVVGVVLGFTAGLIQLVQLSKPAPGEDEPGKGT